MKKNLKVSTSILVLMSFLCLFFLFSCAQAKNHSYQYADTAMGTVIQLTLYTDEKETADIFFQQYMELLHNLEKEQLSWRMENSEIFQLNSSAGTGQEVLISAELAQIIGRCLEMWKCSDGAFDITLGNLVKLWQIDAYASGENDVGEFRVPSVEEIKDALDNCGSDKLLFQNPYHVEPDTEGGIYPTTLTLPPNLQLDLGAVGKGIALDKVSKLLAEHQNISGATISVGGSVFVYGAKPDETNWKVGIINPFDTSGTIGTLTLDDSGWCITTSGDYERYVEMDGVHYHHILDPYTGYPVQNEVKSVSLLTQDGLLGDMLSTACFVLGVEEGMKLAAEYDAEILYALSNGELIMSDGMVQYFHKTFNAPYD